MIMNRLFLINEKLLNKFKKYNILFKGLKFKLNNIL